MAIWKGDETTVRTIPPHDIINAPDLLLRRPLQIAVMHGHEYVTICMFISYDVRSFPMS